MNKEQNLKQFVLYHTFQRFNQPLHQVMNIPVSAELSESINIRMVFPSDDAKIGSLVVVSNDK